MSCPKAYFLRQFKNKIRQEKYLSIINENISYSVILTKFRLSDHELNIEKGRHKKGHNFSTDSPKYAEFLFTSEDLSNLIPLANFIKSALID